MFPEIGDIWMDKDDGQTLLFLTEPRLVDDYIYAQTLNLSDGYISNRTFSYDEKSGGMSEWWQKVG
jgi:hypothetical protein